MLVNLPRTLMSDDGASLTFDPSGAPVSWNSPEQLTIFGAGNPAVGGQGPDLWYAPAVASVPQYFASVMELPAATLAKLTGVKIYEVMLQAPDAALSSFFAFLKQHDLKLSVEALPLVADPGQPGYGVESFGGSGDLINLLSRIKTFGGDLASVAWDEPWAYGHVQTGLYSLEGVAIAVAAAQRQVQEVFPDVQFGDIEPVLASTGAASDLSAWLAAYKSAVGHDLDFFQADTAYWQPQWQSSLATILSIARSRGIATSAIVDGSGDATTATQWATQAVARAELLAADPALRPSSLIIQSWQDLPSILAAPTLAGTLASVLSDVIGSYAATSAIPAVAAYGPNGLLSSVTWTGGYRAINDGVTLRLVSPDGETRFQTDWDKVSRFSFVPTTSTATIAVKLNGVASAYTVAVQADGFQVVPSAQPVFQTSADPLFDAAWYVAQYPQILASGLSPYQHFMTQGWQQGLDPNPFFSTSYYLASNPDVAASGVNPLQHFEQYGWKEARNPSSAFDIGAYYRANPSIPPGTDPLVDFLSNLETSDLSNEDAHKLNVSAPVQSGSLPLPLILPTLATSIPSLSMTPMPEIPVSLPQSPLKPADTLSEEPSVTGAAQSFPDAGTVIRYFETSTGTQFCTASDSEQQTIASSRPDLIAEGPAFNTIATTSGPISTATVNVYRFFDRVNGSHFFTGSATEQAMLEATNLNFIDEGVAFRELAAKTENSEPVYRYFDQRFGTHFLTVSNAEKVAIDQNRHDMKYEGIAFYSPKF